MIMRKRLYTSILYLATILFFAGVFSLILSNIVFYFVSNSIETIKATEIIAYILAIIFVFCFVRCRPLTQEEKKEDFIVRFQLRKDH